MISAGHRPLVPLTGGTFNVPEPCGTLFSGTGADWQIVAPDPARRPSIQFETASERLEWFNECMLIRVRGWQTGGVSYEVHPFR